MKVLTRNDCIPNSYDMDYKGQVLILKPEKLKDIYREAKYQLWKATGGFGCSPTAIGRAVFSECLADDEEARWDRNDFLGVAKDEVIEEVINNG